ncbi:MAG: alpha/beta fold hydrolase [Candidatus Lokiarchaeota archaeon]|nr:alpha/beta fold hydrolase [Candidatus Lokiarchaeota archaeon]
MKPNILLSHCKESPRNTMEKINVVTTEFFSQKEMIRGHFVVPEKIKSPVGICKFHGLPGGPDQVGGIASDLARIGIPVLTFDFRGFRRSDGVFSLRGEIEDARNAVSHLIESEYTSASTVMVYGASFGGAIAVCSAARDTRITAICLRAPLYDTERYSRARAIIPSIFKEIEKESPDVMHGLDDEKTRNQMIDQLIEDAKEFNPMRDISKLAPRPVFITTGTDDEVIDVDGVKRLYHKAGNPKQLEIVQGADHRLSDMETKDITQKLVLNWFSSMTP